MVVTAENADGSTNTSFNGNVTIGDNNWYTLGGTTTVQAVNGVATFSGLTLNTTTKGDSLYAATNGLPTVNSSSFNVNSAAAGQLTMSSPGDMLALARREGAEADTVMVVGHNPGLGQLAAWLALETPAGEARARLAQGFPTAAAAVIAFSPPAFALYLPKALGGGA